MVIEELISYNSILSLELSIVCYKRLFVMINPTIRLIYCVNDPVLSLLDY